MLCGSRHWILFCALLWTSAAFADPPPFTPQTKGALFDALCKGSSPCRVQRVYNAGKSERGAPLQVVEVGLHDQPDDGHAPPYGALDEKGEEILCYTNEFWIYEDSTPPRTEKLLTTCNDGYGASGVGEDTITVSDNKLQIDTYGGSSDRWSERKVWQLSPKRLLSEGGGGYSNFSPESTDDFSWDWETFSGKHEWFLKDCDADGMYKEDGELHAFIAAPIPSLPAFPAADWKQTSLGDCALRIDSEGKGGFITHGKPGNADDAHLRALLIGQQTLILEIQDDTFTAGDAPKWIHDDHIELWLAPKGTSSYNRCFTPKSTPSHQWGIMLDGTVHAAHGKPKDKLTVEVHKVNDTTLRLQITLPTAGFDAITVVYSDSDDGKTQERLLASSKVVFGEVQSLGSDKHISPDAPVACKAEGNTLKPVFK